MSETRSHDGWTRLFPLSFVLNVHLYLIVSPFIRCSEHTMSSSAFLDQYEPLDIIGNGSFGIIRKVRRKTDGVVRLAKPQRVHRH